MPPVFLEVMNMKKNYKLNRSQWLWAYIFIAPMAIGTLIFGIIPIFQSLYYALTNWDGIGEAKYVGLDNFVKILHDNVVYTEIKNTLVYTIFSVPITLFLSVVTAVLLNQKIKATGFFRVVYFLPNIVMPVAAAMIWRYMLNSKFGIVNIFLGALHLPTPSWISDPKFLMSSIIIVTVWTGIGYNAVILLAGLQGISTDIYDSAKIDGSGIISTFFKITIPLLSPTLFFLLTMSIMNAMKSFDLVYAFTKTSGAGPLLDSVRTLVFGIYQRGFTFMKMGEASAEAIILFFMIMIVTVLQFKLQDKWVHYD